MKAKETTLEEPVQTEILWEDATLHSLKIFQIYQESWDICYIYKGDLVRSWKLKA